MSFLKYNFSRGRGLTTILHPLISPMVVIRENILAICVCSKEQPMHTPDVHQEVIDIFFGLPRYILFCLVLEKMKKKKLNIDMDIGTFEWCKYCQKKLWCCKIIFCVLNLIFDGEYFTIFKETFSFGAQSAGVILTQNNCSIKNSFRIRF